MLHTAALSDTYTNAFGYSTRLYRFIRLHRLTKLSNNLTQPQLHFVLAICHPCSSIDITDILDLVSGFLPRFSSRAQILRFN